MFLTFPLMCRCPCWAEDESICARNVNNEVHFFENNNFSMRVFLYISFLQMLLLLWGDFCFQVFLCFFICLNFPLNTAYILFQFGI